MWVKFLVAYMITVGISFCKYHYYITFAKLSLNVFKYHLIMIITLLSLGLMVMIFQISQIISSFQSGLACFTYSWDFQNPVLIPAIPHCVWSHRNTSNLAVFLPEQEFDMFLLLCVISDNVKKKVLQL